MPTYFKVAINEAVRFDCVGDDTAELRKNDWCIVRTERYEDVARVLQVYSTPPQNEMPESAWPVVIRPATLQDQCRVNDNLGRAGTLRTLAEERIVHHHLPMRVVTAHLTYDRNVVLIVFTAPGRVDFRELLRDLTRLFQARVDLRQVGPRDQAAMVGGLGACGRELCCSSFLTNFVSINVKMAKTQGLSLNPSSVMGACGRLKCCLDFEYESYRSLLRGLPRIGSRCACKGCDGRVVDHNPLTQTVKVLLDDDRLVTVPASEVEACSTAPAGGLMTRETLANAARAAREARESRALETAASDSDAADALEAD